MEQPYSVKLPVMVEGGEAPFEGPLDLLLHLIRENKVDIYDIPIALITQQYLEHLELMKELDLEIAGEFLVMAATLIHIKSRMLLPIEEIADTEEPEDPRYELVQRLLEYQAFKDAALGLGEKAEEWAHAFHRESSSEDEAVREEPELSLFDLNMFDLINSFRKVLQSAPEETMTITRETLTVKDKMSFIMEATQAGEALRFEDLFKGDTARSHFIITFVALLELLKLGLLRAYQEKDLGAVWVIRPEEEPAETDRL